MFIEEPPDGDLSIISDQDVPGAPGYPRLPQRWYHHFGERTLSRLATSTVASSVAAPTPCAIVSTGAARRAVRRSVACAIRVHQQEPPGASAISTGDRQAARRTAVGHQVPCPRPGRGALRVASSSHGAGPLRSMMDATRSAAPRVAVRAYGRQCTPSGVRRRGRAASARAGTCPSHRQGHRQTHPATCQASPLTVSPGYGRAATAGEGKEPFARLDEFLTGS